MCGSGKMGEARLILFNFLSRCQSVRFAVERDSESYLA